MNDWKLSAIRLIQSIHPDITEQQMLENRPLFKHELLTYSKVADAATKKLAEKELSWLGYELGHLRYSTMSVAELQGFQRAIEMLKDKLKQEGIL